MLHAQKRLEVCCAHLGSALLTRAWKYSKGDTLAFLCVPNPFLPSGYRVENAINSSCGSLKMLIGAEVVLSN